MTMPDFTGHDGRSCPSLGLPASARRIGCEPDLATLPPGLVAGPGPVVPGDPIEGGLSG